MRQLVELKKYADQFKALNAELVFVFREESEGIEGLKKIKEKHDPPYRLMLDFEKNSSRAYSPEKMAFDNYVIDSTGKVRAIVDGNLRERATAEELLKLLKQIDGEG
jgi:peroxiredoxin